MATFHCTTLKVNKAFTRARTTGVTRAAIYDAPQPSMAVAPQPVITIAEKVSSSAAPFSTQAAPSLVADVADLPASEAKSFFDTNFGIGPKGTAEASNAQQPIIPEPLSEKLPFVDTRSKAVETPEYGMPSGDRPDFRK